MAAKAPLSAYIPFLSTAFQNGLAYGLNYWVFVIGGMLRVVVLYYLWQAVFQSSGQTTISGFDFTQMIVYIALAEMMARVVFNDIDWMIASEIKSGDIAMEFIKPLSYRSRTFFIALGGALFEILFIYVPVLGVVLGVLVPTSGYPLPSLINLGFFLVSAFLSFHISVFFNMSFGFLAFFLKNIWGLDQMKYLIIMILSGAMIPLAFFPEWAQRLFDWLPFSSMVSAPVLFFLEQITWEAAPWVLGRQALWALVFWALSDWVYRVSVKHLTVQGG